MNSGLANASVMHIRQTFFFLLSNDGCYHSKNDIVPASRSSSPELERDPGNETQRDSMPCRREGDCSCLEPSPGLGQWGSDDLRGALSQLRLEGSRDLGEDGGREDTMCYSSEQEARIVRVSHTFFIPLDSSVFFPNANSLECFSSF